MKPINYQSNFLVCLIDRVTVRRASRISVVVGTLLVILNHGDLLWAGSAPALWKVVATYCVPYCVSSYSTASLLSQLARNPRAELVGGTAL